MRTYLKALAVIALGLPVAASAQITGSKHDLSATNSGVSVHAQTQTQLCIFCHTPHHALKQALIWNHSNGNQADSFSAYTTSAGTQIPSTPVLGPSLACLSCHDGSQAIGAVNNTGGGSAGTITMATANADLNSSGQLQATSYANVTGGNSGGSGTMNNNHPVSIPYAGATYNGISSAAKATAAVGYYNLVATGSSCNSASGVCTAGATGGTNINLYGSSATNAGVECGSCHEVHNKYGSANGFFLRAPQAGSSLCLACHNK